MTPSRRHPEAPALPHCAVRKGRFREDGERTGDPRDMHAAPIHDRGDRASKTPICDHEISERARDDRVPRDSWGAPARRLCRGNCAETVCVKMNCAKRLYRDSRVEYGMGCKPLRTAQTPPISRAGFDTGCKPSRAARPLPRSARSCPALSELNQIGAV